MIKRAISWMIYPPVTGPVSIIVIRLMPGAVFCYEGITNMAMAGSGTDGVFTLIMAISGMIESLLLAGGLFTRIGALLVLFHSLISMLFTGLGGITCCDYAQILTGLFLVLEGAGRWSLDFYIATHRQPIFKINQNK